MLLVYKTNYEYINMSFIYHIIFNALKTFSYITEEKQKKLILISERQPLTYLD